MHFEYLRWDESIEKALRDFADEAGAAVDLQSGLLVCIQPVVGQQSVEFLNSVFQPFEFLLDYWVHV